MQILVTTDNHIKGGEPLELQVQAAVESTLSRFDEWLSRIEVHLSDENAHKGGEDDKKCVMEARPRGMQPVAVTHKAGTVDDAIDGAAEKLEHLLGHTFGKLGNPKGRQTSMGGDQDFESV